MKPPNWMMQVPPYKGTLSEDGRNVVFTFHVRLWHPGFWMAVARYWWTHR